MHSNKQPAWNHAGRFLFAWNAPRRKDGGKNRARRSKIWITIKFSFLPA